MDAIRDYHPGYSAPRVHEAQQQLTNLSVAAPVSSDYHNMPVATQMEASASGRPPVENTCIIEEGVGPVTVKRNNSCIGQDDPISLEILEQSDDPICLNGKCYALESIKEALMHKPTDPASRRSVKDLENILGLEVDDNNIIKKQRSLAARNIVRSNYYEQQARQEANQFRQETINSLMSEPLPTNKRDRLRELMRRKLELENLNSMLQSLLRDAIETDNAIYQNQLEEANQDAGVEGLMLGLQTIGGKVKKTKRKQHRKNKMTKRRKKKCKKTRRK